MISETLERYFNLAIKDANSSRHEYLSFELVFKYLLNDPTVKQILSLCGADIAEIESELLDYLNDEGNFSLLSEKELKKLGKSQFKDKEMRKLAEKDGIFYQPEMTIALRRILQRAAMHVQSSGKTKIQAINILVALFYENESFSKYLLAKRGIDRYRIVEKIAHSIDKPVNSLETTDRAIDPLDPDAEEKSSVIDKYLVDYNKQAKDEKFDLLIGRENEIERICQVLCRRKKNNPLLVGDPGVGKTALAQGLTSAIVAGRVPKILENCVVYGLDLASLMAGTKFRGEFEQRLKSILAELLKIKENGNDPILFIDEMHTIIGAGSTSGGSLDASNLLKPAFASGEIRFLGATSYEEFRKFVEKESAIARRFQKVDVPEPSNEETIQILKGLIPKFEEHHGVTYPMPVLKHAVELANRYLFDKKLPDKAIDVIDEVGSYNQLLPASKRKKSISVKDLEKVMAKMANVPEQNLASNEKQKLKNLKNDLKMVIYGQDEAIETVGDAIVLARSGLKDREKPICQFIFAGPTGVGKTELAKQLALLLVIKFIRFDMSEYMEKHSISKLIGAPPGYVGFEQGGELTDTVHKSPYSVLLLDELEKAHPDIFNILLQIMDHGFLTDANGRKTSFKNTLIIMTTNAGAKEMEAGSIGLDTNSTAPVKRDHAIKNFFTPEFRNRLDSVIHFNKLGTESLLLLVEKFISQLESRLNPKKIYLDIDETTKKWIGNSAYDPKLGARPIERYLQEQLYGPISEQMLYGSLEKGGKVKVWVEKNELKLQFFAKNS